MPAAWPAINWTGSSVDSTRTTGTLCRRSVLAYARCASMRGASIESCTWRSSRKPCTCSTPSRRKRSGSQSRIWSSRPRGSVSSAKNGDDSDSKTQDAPWKWQRVSRYRFCQGRGTEPRPAFRADDSNQRVREGAAVLRRLRLQLVLGITQPRLNALLRGKIEEFSLDALVNVATRAGLHVALKVGKAPVRNAA